MQPNIKDRILYIKLSLEDIINYQALDQTLDRDMELQYIKDAVESLEEIYESLR